ncbi:MAG TPA: sigma-70 family RNA polymerase sigma factor [Solirubrobacteraceae bacterium]
MASSGPEAAEVDPPERAGDIDRERGEALVLELLGAHADSLLRVARRYSMCADDAHDAYQRGLEILMRHAARLDPERAAGWLHTVVKHEALAINRSRRRIVGFAEVDLDALESRTSASPEERVLASDRVARSAEALHGLKPQEVRALWLKALGHSYEQICEVTGWTYTKVNRCLAEGRKSFLERYAGIESGQECERLAPALSAFVDGEADAAQTVALRAHLRQCLACRATVRGLHDASQPLTVVFPASALVVANGGVEHTGSFFVRVYETVSLHLHERAANSFLRAQAVFDTVTAGKMAAAAASAAAVAGGGFAVEGVVSPAAPDRPAAILRGAVGGGGAPALATVARTHARAKSRSPAARKPRSGQRARRRPRASAASSRRTPKPAATTAATATTTAASQPRAPAQPRAVAASAGAPRAGGSAAGEFGFEGP